MVRVDLRRAWSQFTVTSAKFVRLPLLANRFAGMLIGKALYERQFLDIPFTKIMYKLILEEEVGLDDLKEVDPTLWKSLSWMIENEIEDIIYETFSVEKTDPLTKKKESISLCEDGEDRQVTDENKSELLYSSQVSLFGRLGRSLRRKANSAVAAPILLFR